MGQDVQDDEIIRLSFEDETALEVLEEVRIGEDRVPLLDVASIESVESTPADIVQYNGEDAISFTVFLSSEEDVPSVSENVESVINERFDSMPDSVTADNISSERLSVGLVRFTPFEFFPESDRSEVTVDLIFDEGQTIQKTHEDTEEILAHLLEDMDHMEGSSTFTGEGLPNLFGASLDQSGENTAQIALQIDKEQMSASATIDEYEAPLREAFPDAKIFMNTIIQGPPASAPITVEFFEEDLDTLSSGVAELTKQLENEGAIVTSSIGNPVETLQYSIDYDALEENDISISQVKNELNMI